MSATDVVMAKALVELLEGEMPFSNQSTVYYARSTEVELVAISAPRIYVGSTLEHIRQSRGTWSKSVTLTVKALGPQSQTGHSGDNDTETEKDNWLAFIDDELVEAIKNARISGKLPAAITFTDRLTASRVNDESLFQTEFSITYPVV